MGLIFFALAGFLIWGLYKLIHMQGVIGLYFRWAWNIVAWGFSLVPGFGFMARLIVTDDEETKEQMIRDGEQSDNEYLARLEREKQERLAREEEERNKKVEVYKKTYHNGYVTTEKMQVNSTNDMYKDEHGEWRKISELK